jgi:hypothetical protein
MRHAARCLTRTSDLLGSCGGHEFGLGLAFAVPGGHEQNFVSERITEYVVDIGRAIDFKETRAAGVCPVQPSVDQNAQFGELLRLVLPQVFNHSR